MSKRATRDSALDAEKLSRLWHRLQEGCKESRRTLKKRDQTPVKHEGELLLLGCKLHGQTLAKTPAALGMVRERRRDRGSNNGAREPVDARYGPRSPLLSPIHTKRTNRSHSFVRSSHKLRHPRVKSSLKLRAVDSLMNWVLLATNITHPPPCSSLRSHSFSLSYKDPPIVFFSRRNIAVSTKLFVILYIVFIVPLLHSRSRPRTWKSSPQPALLSLVFTAATAPASSPPRNSLKSALWKIKTSFFS